MENISYISFMTQTQYEEYSVNESGDVFSTKFNKVRKLKPFKHPKGYLLIDIWNDNQRKQMLVHRLIAETFISNPQNKPEVNHKNGIKSDNRVQNLEWNTPKENMNHAKSTGLWNIGGENHYRAKLTKEQVLEIRKLHSTKTFNQRKLAKMFDVGIPQISNIVNKKYWKDI
jgi:hypothetical protein